MRSGRKAQPHTRLEGAAVEARVLRWSELCKQAVHACNAGQPATHACVHAQTAEPKAQFAHRTPPTQQLLPTWNDVYLEAMVMPRSFSNWLLSITRSSLHGADRWMGQGKGKQRHSSSSGGGARRATAGSPEAEVAAGGGGGHSPQGGAAEG
jgi:hypothetical protein